MNTLSFGLINHAVLLNEKSMSERLKAAGLNSILGLVIVFAVLTVIILIIALLKYIPDLGRKKTEQQEPTPSVEDPVLPQITEQAEEENLIDDYELVAVITAAIYASMNDSVPADGLVVRSIRKVNNRRRINAF